MASFPSKRALSFLISIETSRFSSSLPSSQSLLPKNPAVEGGEIRNFDGSRASEKNLGFVVPSRSVHFSAAAPLGFRASDAVRAEYAVADFSDEEKAPGKKSSDSDEGLEISKLGISHEIVSALANKGITRLFPIQVYSFSFLMYDFTLFSHSAVVSDSEPVMQRVLHSERRIHNWFWSDSGKSN